MWMLSKSRHAIIIFFHFGLSFLQKTKWARCKKLMSGYEKPNTNSFILNDSDIYKIYKPDEQDCAHVIQARFPHPPVSKEEQQFPIAFGLTVYKGARLFERILQAIYMPHNVYCIHIDKKSPEVFHRVVKAMTRCLPNVFLASKRMDVVWGHISVVQAQLSCMEEPLQSSMKWKYYISLIGQDFPLYDNRQIVAALKRLHNLNSIGSIPIPTYNEERTKFVHTFKNGLPYITSERKLPPPHNISIYKGSTHIIAIREFVDFLIHSTIAKDFIEFLKDTFVPDETVYSSLQQHPLAPGGIHGEQPKTIARVLHWTPCECHGAWIRSLCWIAIQDLRWVLGREMKHRLFVHKIPFDFSDDLLKCILLARQGRQYSTFLSERQENNTKCYSYHG